MMTNKNAVKNTGFATHSATRNNRNKSSTRIKFNDAIIRNLKPQEKRITYYCEGLDGFGIRIGPTGRKTWIYLYRLNQKPRRLTIGRYPKVSLAEAKSIYHDAHNKTLMGIDPGNEKIENDHKEKEAFTVTELCCQYIDFCKLKGEKRWKEKERALKRDLLPIIGSRKAYTITFRDISPIINQVFTERGSIEGAKHLLSYCRTMFKYAKNGLGLIEVNPCADLEPPARRVPKTPRALSPEEIYLFWNNIDNTNMTHVVKLGMKFMLCTLQRGTEVRHMEWKEVNLKEKIWIIPSNKAKNNRTHLVPLNSFALDILNTVKDFTGHSEYVFGYNNIWKMKPNEKPVLKPMCSTAFNHSSRVNFDHYQINDHFTPHELRKTGATRLTSVGFPRDIVKRLLNHKETDVTAVYDLFDYFEEKRAGMESINYILERILSSRDAETVPSVKTLRKEFVTKGLVYEFMKEDYYSPKKSNNELGHQSTLSSPVSYSLSFSLSE